MSAVQRFETFRATGTYRVIYRIWSALLLARVIIIAAALGVILLNVAIAHAQAAKPDYAGAYAYALKCFVASRDNGDADAATRTAYDAVLKLGHAQGLTDSRINADFTRAIASEMIKFRRDESYRQSTLQTCQRLGLTG